MLDEQTIATLLTELQSINYLAEEKSPNSIDLVNQLENQQTIEELEHCLRSQPSNDIEQKLIEQLAKRWERIRDSSMSYTQSPFNPLNRFCLKLAQTLYPIPADKQAINEMAERKGPYFLLMPSLQKSFDIVGDNIHHLALHEFVLSDNEQLYIPIQLCLDSAADSDSSEFRHLVSETEHHYHLLSQTEKQRLLHHSTCLAAYIEAIIDYHDSRTNKSHLDGQLQRLRDALLSGGAHQGGMEFNAGNVANEGIVAFALYWSNLPFIQQQAYFKQYPGLEEMLGRLMRPEKSDYQEVRYCVELIAEALEPIIQAVIRSRENKLSAFSNESIQVFQKIMWEKKEDVEKAFSSPFTYPMLPSKQQLPEVLTSLLNNNYDYFSDNLWKKSINLAIKQNHSLIIPLLEKVLEQNRLDVLKEKYPLNINHFSSLMLAISQGSTELVRRLLDLDGLNYLLEETNKQGDTPLHLAAHNDALDILQLLLEKGAQGNKSGYKGNTALHWAGIKNNSPIFMKLLEYKVDITCRNNEGKNILDIMVYSSQLLRAVLLHMISLDKEQQKEMLRKRPGNYEDALSYAASVQPSLLRDLLTKMLEQNSEFLDSKYRTKSGSTLLTMAISHESMSLVHQLLDRLPALLEEPNGKGSSPLHVAAELGYLDIVNYLLEKNAHIDEIGFLGNTALHWAILNDNFSVFMRLLEQGGNIEIRNQAGENILDIARLGHQQMIPSLLLRMLFLDLEQQCEMLSKVPGNYDNVLSYALGNNHSQLVLTLLTTMLEQNNYELLNKSYKVKGTKANILIVAISYGNIALVQQVLDKLPLLLTAQDEKNDTALSWAAFEGKLDILHLLLDKGIDINKAASDGNTALHWAIGRDHFEVIKELIERGANISSRNNQGKNSLDKALITEKQQQIDFILLEMASLTIDKQQEMLSNIPGSYNNVLSYTAEKQPHLIPALLTKLATKLNLVEQKEILITIANGQYSTIVGYLICEKPALLAKLRQNPDFPIPKELFLFTEPKALDQIVSAKKHFEKQINALSGISKSVTQWNKIYKQRAENTLESLQNDLRCLGKYYFQAPTAENFNLFKTECTRCLHHVESVLHSLNSMNSNKEEQEDLANGTLHYVFKSIEKIFSNNPPSFFFQPEQKTKSIHDLIYSLETTIYSGLDDEMKISP